MWCALGAIGLLWPSTLLHAEERPSQANAGFDLSVTRGNNDSMQMRAQIQTESRQGDNLFRLAVEGAYGQTRIEREDGTTYDEVTAQNAKGNVNWKRLFGRAYGYLDASVLHDDVAAVDYRVIASPGIGYYIARTAKVRLSAEAGPAYVGEKVNGVTDAYWAFRFAERFEWQIHQSARLWQTVEFLPRVEDFEDYLVNAEAGIETLIEGNLGLRVVVQEKYDRTPAEGKKRADLTLLAGVTLKLW